MKKDILEQVLKLKELKDKKKYEDLFSQVLEKLSQDWTGPKGIPGKNLQYQDLFEEQKQELAKNISLFIEKPQDGKTPTVEELTLLITPLIPKKPKDGKTPQLGVDFLTDGDVDDLCENILAKLKLSIPEELSPDDVITKIEKSNKKIDASKIKNLPEQIDNITDIEKLRVDVLGMARNKGAIKVKDDGSKVGTFHNINFTNATITKNGSDDVTIDVGSGGGGGVSQHANIGDFPGTGEDDILYIALDTDLSYYWDGAAYQLVGDGTGETITASNGLTRTGDDIAWGGSLSDDVNIDGAGNGIYFENLSEFEMEDGLGTTFHLSSYMSFVGSGGATWIAGNDHVFNTDQLYLDTSTDFSGFQTTSPNSTLHVNGSFSTSYKEATTTYTILSNDHTIDCTSGTFTVTLPTAAGITGRQYVIKNTGTGVITLDGAGSETIDDVATKTLYQYESLTVESNGQDWIIIGEVLRSSDEYQHMGVRCAYNGNYWRGMDATNSWKDTTIASILATATTKTASDLTGTSYSTGGYTIHTDGQVVSATVNIKNLLATTQDLYFAVLRLQNNATNLACIDARVIEISNATAGQFSGSTLTFNTPMDVLEGEVLSFAIASETPNVGTIYSPADLSVKIIYN